MFNYGKLKGKIKEKDMTQKDVSDFINIAVSSLNLKLNNKSPFTQDEIFKLINILDIPSEEVCSYFFEEKV